MNKAARFLAGAALAVWWTAGAGAAGAGMFAPLSESGEPQAAAVTSGGVAGPETPGLVVDAQGRKTLVIHENEPPLIVTGDPEPRPTAAQATAEGPINPPAEKPYWAVDEKEPERPYFRVEKQAPAAPYWRAEKRGPEVPYWRAAEKRNDRPYWLSWKPEPAPQPAPPPPTAQQIKAAAEKTALESGRRIISYYMFTDEEGVTHLTNVPADSRYRLFTVEVRLSRGLAPRKTRFTHQTLRPHILDAAAAFDLDPALIAAVIRSESAFDSQAVSWAGAQGLMQLMPGTARDMGCRDPFDPRQNIMGGSRYLRLMLDRFHGDLTLALAAYNAGPERVARRWRVPDIAETKNYVKIVMRNYDGYQGQF